VCDLSGHLRCAFLINVGRGNQLTRKRKQYPA
jgi:hypothetical protein